MDLKGANVLLAGATGFLGKAATETLTANGCLTTAITRQTSLPARNGVHWLSCDLNDLSALTAAAAGWPLWDAVIYLAASIPVAGQKKENPRTACENSLMPLLNLLEALGGRYNRFVYASSVDVYGVPQQIEYREDHPLAPFTPYALAKLAGEYYVKCDASTAGRQSSVLRFAQIYGPGEPVVRVIPYIRNALQLSKPFRLVSTGKELRRFVYLSDAAEAVIRALKSDRTGTYNIAGPESISLLQLISKFETASNKKLTLERVDDPATAFDNVPSIQSAEKDLGFLPKTDMQAGLNMIWASLR